MAENISQNYIISKIYSFNYEIIQYPVIGATLGAMHWGPWGGAAGLIAGTIDTYFIEKKLLQHPYLTYGILGATGFFPLANSIKISLLNNNNEKKTETPVAEAVSPRPKGDIPFADIKIVMPINHKLKNIPSSESLGSNIDDQRVISTRRSAAKFRLKLASPDDNKKLNDDQSSITSTYKGVDFNLPNITPVEGIGFIIGLLYPLLSSNIPHYHLKHLSNSIFDGYILAKRLSKSELKYFPNNMCFDLSCILLTTSLSLIDSLMIYSGLSSNYYYSHFLKSFLHYDNIISLADFVLARLKIEHINSILKYMPDKYSSFIIVYPILVYFDSKEKHDTKYKFAFQTNLETLEQALAKKISEYEITKISDKIFVTTTAVQFFINHFMLKMYEEKNLINNFFNYFSKKDYSNIDYEERSRSLPFFKILISYGLYSLSSYLVTPFIAIFISNDVYTIFSNSYQSLYKNDHFAISLEDGISSKNKGNITYLTYSNMMKDLPQAIDYEIKKLTEVSSSTVSGVYAYINIISLEDYYINYYIEYFKHFYSFLANKLKRKINYHYLWTQIEYKESECQKYEDYRNHNAKQIAKMTGESSYISELIISCKTTLSKLKSKNKCMTIFGDFLEINLPLIIINIIIPYLGLKYFTENRNIRHNIWKIMPLAGTSHRNNIPIFSPYNKTFVAIRKIDELIAKIEKNTAPFLKFNAIKSNYNYFCLEDFTLQIKEITKIRNKDEFCFFGTIHFNGENQSGKSSFLTAIMLAANNITEPNVKISGIVTFYNSNGAIPTFILTDQHYEFLSGSNIINTITSSTDYNNHMVLNSNLTLIEELFTELNLNSRSSENYSFTDLLRSTPNWRSESGGTKNKILLTKTIYKALEFLKSNKTLVVGLDELIQHLDTSSQTKFYKLCKKYFNGAQLIIIDHKDEENEIFDSVIEINNKTLVLASFNYKAQEILEYHSTNHKILNSTFTDYESKYEEYTCYNIPLGEYLGNTCVNQMPTLSS